MVVRYGVWYDYAGRPDMRLSLYWFPERPRPTSETSAVLFVVFPRIKVEW